MKIKEKNKLKLLKVLKPAEHKQKPKSIEVIFPKDLENSEIQNELNKIKKLEEKINRNDLIYELSNYKYDFRNIPIIISFGDSIFNGK